VKAILAILLVMVPVGCKDRGEIVLDLDIPLECTPVTHVRPFLISGASCDECGCGSCVDACELDNCEIGCDGGFCPVEVLDEGLPMQPPSGGRYMVVYQLAVEDGPESYRILATSCTEVDVDDDGTDSSEIRVVARCCALPAR